MQAHPSLIVQDLGTEPDDSIIAHSNGFDDSITRAFQQDLHLVFPPDDVWLAIMTISASMSRNMPKGFAADFSIRKTRRTS
jgi:hypothetical protein